MLCPGYSISEHYYTHSFEAVLISGPFPTADGCALPTSSHELQISIAVHTTTTTIAAAAAPIKKMATDQAHAASFERHQAVQGIMS